MKAMRVMEVSNNKYNKYKKTTIKAIEKNKNSKLINKAAYRFEVSACRKGKQ